MKLQQHLPFTVCAAECEEAEEQSDDEAHTLQVPKRSGGKTKVIKEWYLPFTVLKLTNIFRSEIILLTVATAPIVYDMRRRV